MLQGLKADGPDRPFVKACIDYLREKLLGGGATSRVGVGGGSSSVNVLSVDAAAVFFRILLQSELPELLTEAVSSLYTQCVQAKPKLQALFSPASSEPARGAGAGAAPPAPAAGGAQEPPPAEPEVANPSPPPSLAAAEMPVAAAAAPAPVSMPVPATAAVQPAAQPAPPAGANPASQSALATMTGVEGVQFSAEVEEEANSYFQRIYNDAATIEDIIAMLKRFQASSIVHEQQVRSSFPCTRTHNTASTPPSSPTAPLARAKILRARRMRMLVEAMTTVLSCPEHR